MSKPVPALAVWACWAAMFAPAAPAADTQALSLDQAFERTLELHPALRRLPFRRTALAAELASADQRPPLELALGVENVGASGAVRGVEGAEITLGLQSVLERPERRAARIGLVRSQLAELDVDLEAARLDLLAEVARRYLDALAAQAERVALVESLAQREATVAAARRRVAAGASPQAVVLGAEAALARARLELARAEQAGQGARLRLALLWGATAADFDRVDGDLMRLPTVPDFSELLALLARTPELRRFASEARIREARLQLARSQLRPDIGWQVGLRRLQSSDDWALVGSVSVALGSRVRAQPAIQAAQAELAELELARDSGELALRGTLAEAHGRMLGEQLAVHEAGASILPVLRDAERSAGRAYRAGALSHLEWAQLQADLLAARRERIAAAREFHRALIEVQRLTAEPFVLAASAAQETSL
jgi:cobalt-zinc-cadmium efflux system outer membrane protein